MIQVNTVTAAPHTQPGRDSLNILASERIIFRNGLT